MSETVKKCRNTFVILVANAIKPENEVQFTALKNHTTNERCNKYKTTWKSALQDWKGQKCQEIAWSFFSGLDTEMIQTVKKTLMKTFRFDMERNKATMGRGTTWLYRRYVECSGFCDQCALRCYNSTKAGGLLQGKHIKKLIRKTKVYISMTLFGPFHCKKRSEMFQISCWVHFRPILMTYLIDFCRFSLKKGPENAIRI